LHIEPGRPCAGAATDWAAIQGTDPLFHDRIGGKTVRKSAATEKEFVDLMTS
jgi:hypothetical protein